MVKDYFITAFSLRRKTAYSIAYARKRAGHNLNRTLKGGRDTMAQYIDQIAGYIADNSNIDFERCDGKVFSYYEVSTANMNATNNT